MNDYRERVATAALIRDGEPIYNESLRHAAVLAEELMRSAEHSVKILSGEFNSKVFGTKEFIDAAMGFLVDENHKIQILVEDLEPREMQRHPFFKECSLDEYPDQIEVRAVDNELSLRYGFHVMVVDGCSYRFEGDKNKRSAIAAFGDNTGAQNLGSVYDAIWAAAADPVGLNSAVFQMPNG